MDELASNHAIPPNVYKALGFGFAPCAFASASLANKARATFRANKVLAELVIGMVSAMERSGWFSQEQIRQQVGMAVELAATTLDRATRKEAA